MTTRERRRAAALPPDERRAAIVAAALPLVVAHGTAVTTRQIAEAADIAEGTIFRVFADKDELLDTVLEAALDPAPEVEAIDALDPSAPLEQRLTAVVVVLQGRVERVWRAMAAIGTPGSSSSRAARRQADDPPEVGAIAELLAGDAAAFRLPVPEVARLVRSITFAMTHPALAGDRPARPAEVVAVLIDGIGRR